MYLWCKSGRSPTNVLVSVCVSISCVMAWWWVEFRVETGCHINKTIYKGVRCDCEYLDIAHEFVFILESQCALQNSRNFALFVFNASGKLIY